MLLTCIPSLMTTVTFINRCGLVGDPHATPHCVLTGDPHATPHHGLAGDPHAHHCRGLVSDSHAISSCCGLVGDPHMLNSIHGLVDDPQDSLALSRSFKTSQVDLFVSVSFVAPFFFGRQAKARYWLNTMDSLGTPNSNSSPAHESSPRQQSQANICSC
jgi:hypothetical protein